MLHVHLVDAMSMQKRIPATPGRGWQGFTKALQLNSYLKPQRSILTVAFVGWLSLLD